MLLLLGLYYIQDSYYTKDFNTTSLCSLIIYLNFYVNQ